MFVRGHAQIKADIVQMAEGQHAVVFQIGQGSFHLSVRQPAAQAGGKDKEGIEIAFNRMIELLNE